MRVKFGKTRKQSFHSRTYICNNFICRHTKERVGQIIILPLYTKIILTCIFKKHTLPLYYIRLVQRRLKNRNHSLTSVVIRIHAPMEAPVLRDVKTLKTSSTAHVLWNITADFVKNEEQHHVKSSCRKTEGTDPESMNC